jgi:hypothetical protein
MSGAYRDFGSGTGLRARHTRIAAMSHTDPENGLVVGVDSAPCVTRRAFVCAPEGRACGGASRGD